MGLGWKHPVHDAGPDGAGWRVHPWMGQPYQWVQCFTCSGRGVIGMSGPGGYWADYCPTCDGTRWTLQPTHGEVKSP